MVEHSAVNRRVAGSSPASGAMINSSAFAGVFYITRNNTSQGETLWVPYGSLHIPSGSARKQICQDADFGVIGVKISVVRRVFQLLYNVNHRSKVA